MRSRNFPDGFRFASSGLWYALRTHRDTRSHLTTAVAVLVLGLVLPGSHRHRGQPEEGNDVA